MRLDDALHSILLGIGELEVREHHRAEHAAGPAHPAARSAAAARSTESSAAAVRPLRSIPVRRVVCIAPTIDVLARGEGAACHGDGHDHRAGAERNPSNCSVHAVLPKQAVQGVQRGPVFLSYWTGTPWQEGVAIVKEP